MLVNFLLVATLCYLRISTIYLTLKMVRGSLAVEANPFMKKIINGNKTQLLLNESILLTGCVFISFVFLSPGFYGYIFIIIFIMWIDFQHDWELYNILK